jgi:hypothetical protein
MRNLLVGRNLRDDKGELCVRQFLQQRTTFSLYRKGQRSEKLKQFYLPRKIDWLTGCIVPLPRCNLFTNRIGTSIQQIHAR